MTTMDLADLALFDTIAQAIAPRARAEAIRHYAAVQAMAPKPIDMEPARFAITGVYAGCGLRFADGFYGAEAGAIDAPQYTPRGSVRGTDTDDGRVYVSASDWICAR